VAPLEPWEKVLISEAFLETVHGHIACTDCHQGEQSSEKEIAHTDLIRRPSMDPEAACGDCHTNIASVQAQSLHASLAGYTTVLHARSVPENHETLDGMFNNHCASCHATCGDCHVTQPYYVGGGFLSGHEFQRTPPMTRTCTGCHGSRVGDEYLGKREDVRADVHFRQGRMTCVSCHTGDEMHGQPDNCQDCHTGPVVEEAMPREHRYHGVAKPSCGSCHVESTTGRDGNEMHEQHGADLSCQVCHSIAYSNCESCHVQISETTGNPFYVSQNTFYNFLIGLNPIRSAQRPYKYTPVRRVPVDPDSYAFYGEDLLPNFDALPTWAHATPHNIQRNTPQTESCNSCHGNAAIFLTEDKLLKETHLEANRPVIVTNIPAPIGITTTETLTPTLPIETEEP
jgi:hypothetical protein